MRQQSSRSLYRFLHRSTNSWRPSPPPTRFSTLSSSTLSPISILRHFLHRWSSTPSPHLATPQNPRNYGSESSSTTPDFDVHKVVDEINLKFAEAREEIESAMDSKETVYFDEEAESARAAVKQVLEMFEDLLEKLKGRERDALLRSMGLKIEQLKAELQQLND
ncbi:hypothetical protein Dimus_005178 [Dionaea muscipula]